MDFGFGFPWRADGEVFHAAGWRDMLCKVHGLYEKHRTARAVAAAINAEARFAGHGPFRFDDNRTDWQFHSIRSVAYYRLVELVVPQAISQWYMGAGRTVAFHTLTGMSALFDLLAVRDAGKIGFHIWPQEGMEPDDATHVIVESYPSLFPRCDEEDGFRDEHERDASRVLEWLRRKDAAGALRAVFQVPEKRFGRIEGVSFIDQVSFEGWIIGVT